VQWNNLPSLFTSSLPYICLIFLTCYISLFVKVSFFVDCHESSRRFRCCLIVLYKANYICICHYLGSGIKFPYIFFVSFVTNYAVRLHIWHLSLPRVLLCLLYSVLTNTAQCCPTMYNSHFATSDYCACLYFSDISSTTASFCALQYFTSTSLSCISAGTTVSIVSCLRTGHSSHTQGYKDHTVSYS